jgi:hypothetical protein
MTRARRCGLVPAKAVAELAPAVDIEHAYFGAIERRVPHDWRGDLWGMRGDCAHLADRERRR